MTENDQKQLGKTLRAIADQLRGSMNADDFRDYILSAIVTLDSQEPKEGPRKKLESVLDFACGSGSLLLNIRHRMKEAGGSIGKIYGLEYNVTTYRASRRCMTN